MKTREKIAALAATLILTAGLSVAASPAATGYYNKVWNNTGSTLSVIELDGFRYGMSAYSPGNYGYDIRSVWVPRGACRQFVGPGVNQRFCAYGLGTWKSIGAGTWWVYKA